jgi:hypothetical protein
MGEGTGWGIRCMLGEVIQKRMYSPVQYIQPSATEIEALLDDSFCFLILKIHPSESLVNAPLPTPCLMFQIRDYYENFFDRKAFFRYT